MDYRAIGAMLDGALSTYNFQVSPKAPAGRPGKNDKSLREYRLQLINKQNDTSENLKKVITNVISAVFQDAQNVKLNPLSVNSSKFSSCSFTTNGVKVDAIIAKGANKGENFEVATTKDLASAFNARGTNAKIEELITQLGLANKEFADVEISQVKQRVGSTRKTGVPVEKMGEIIGDIILTDQNRKNWFVSLKDVNGITFSAYPGAATLIKDHVVQPKSDAAKFLEAFGVDLAAVQIGYNERRGINSGSYRPKPPRPNTAKLKSIFEHAWGMNYFYVRRKSVGWEVFWIDRRKLDKLTSNIRVESITYPSKKTKSIVILCSNQEKRYRVEMRNSKGDEYPNDIKFQVR